jgi:hypothetical protein
VGTRHLSGNERWTSGLLFYILPSEPDSFLAAHDKVPKGRLKISQDAVLGLGYPEMIREPEGPAITASEARPRNSPCSTTPTMLLMVCATAGGSVISP